MNVEHSVAFTWQEGEMLCIEAFTVPPDVVLELRAKCRNEGRLCMQSKQRAFAPDPSQQPPPQGDLPHG